MWDVYVYFFLIAASVVIWALKYRGLSPGVRALGVIQLITLVFEGYAAYLMVRKTVNLHIYHVLIPAQFLFYSYVYARELTGSNIKKAIFYAMPLYVGFAFLVLIGFQSSSEFNSYTRVGKNVLITCWALLYYKEVFLGLKVKRLVEEPMFWISTGLWFYSLGNVFVEGLMNHLLSQSSRWAETIYYVNVLLGLLLHLLFVVAFWVSGGKPGFSNGLFRTSH
ncbi:hypothetical protein [Rufibacter sp. LB8]|uniref:hypothetical protein n=1 Tax=Rufibacter sp. LB8 TaxID=2777781 RepID=UPI00178C38CF|nr:hypothetical protein [Rufibacter sp. LB8]